MALRIFLAIFVATALSALTGCDGDVGFHGVEGALERTSGRKLIRGLADQAQQINEDEERTKSRRNAVEAIAERNSLNLSDNLGDILKDNKFYHNIVFTNLMKDVPGLPGYPVQVEFGIDGGYHVQLRFIVVQMTMLGFVHLTRLPIFESGSIKNGDDVLPIQPVELFTLVLAEDQNALKARSDQVWGPIQAQQLAEAAADKEANCEKQIQEQAIDFEVDPSLGDEEKQAEITKFQSAQSAAIKECLAR